MKTGKNIKGFTLVELLVVISIIGVLATIVLTALGDSRDKAKMAKTQVELRQLQNGMELYYADNGEYPHPTASPNDYYYIDVNNAGNNQYYDDLKTKLDPYFDIDDLFDDTPDSFGYFTLRPTYSPSECPSQTNGGNFQTYALTFSTWGTNDDRSSSYPGFTGYVTEENMSEFPIMSGFYIGSQNVSVGGGWSNIRHDHCATI